MGDALKNDRRPGKSPQLVIRKQTSLSRDEASVTASTPSAGRPLIRRTSEPERGAGPILRRTTPTPTQSPQGGQVLRRSTPPQSGSVLRRSASPVAGSVLSRTRAPSPSARAGGPRAGGQRGPPQNRQGGDKRRRAARKSDNEDDGDHEALETQLDNYVARHIDRPENPTEPVPYEPASLNLDDLRSDWPNTPLSSSGMTESVIQKIEWLSKRLPHGYQTPEDIAEHYLRGNLTRFESEEEKQLVLKIASEMTAKTKTESEEDTLHKHETPRFQIVEDANFTSISGKEADKSFLVEAAVKGDYGEVQKQPYPFMQGAARLLNNNGSYGPESMQRFLGRVQALIPQRGAAAQQVKKA